MVRRCIDLGFGGIAFTDHESLSPAIQIIKIRDEIEKDHPDFKIIFGNEIYLIDESQIKNNPKYYHFVLLAKDLEGWEQLRRLSSRAWERGYTERGVMRVPTTYSDIEEIVGTNPGHLISSSACVGGELPTAILSNDEDRVHEFINWCIKNFGRDNFVLELQPSDNEEQVVVNRRLISLSKEFGLKYIITTDSHYLMKEDFPIHSAFLNSKQSQDRETEKFYKYTYIMTEEEMSSILGDSENGLTEEEIKTGFANTVLVGDMIEKFDFRHSTIVPCIKIPEYSLSHSLYKKGYEMIDKFYDSPNEQDRFLIYQIEQGLVEKKVVIDENKLQRINTELDILDYIGNRIDQKLSAYLNLTKNIVDLAWKVSLVGCGRGSACGFYINYLIGITQADPLIYNLPEWRFLNKERAELPKTQHWAG